MIKMEFEFFNKHHIELSYEVKFKEDIILTNIMKICELNNIEYKSFYKYEDIKYIIIYIRNYRIRFFHNNIQIFIFKNYDYALLNELSQLFNVKCDNMHILIYYVTVKKPDMTLYFQSLNEKHHITQYHIRYLEYDSTMTIYSNRISMCDKSINNIKNMYMHLYTTTKLPHVLSILSDHSNSLFNLLPYEVIDIILNRSQN